MNVLEIIKTQLEMIEEKLITISMWTGRLVTLVLMVVIGGIIPVFVSSCIGFLLAIVTTPDPCELAQQCRPSGYSEAYCNAIEEIQE